MKNWEDWCRLCANENSNKFYDLYISSDDNPPLSKVIQKHFQVIIESNDGRPKIICENCYKFINMLMIFNSRCMETESLYTDILCSSNGPQSINKIKKQYLENETFNILEFTQIDFNNFKHKNCNELYKKKTSTKDSTGFKIKIENSEDIQNDSHGNFLNNSSDDFVSNTKEEIIDDSYNSGNDDKNSSTYSYEVKVNTEKKNQQTEVKKQKKKTNYDGYFKCEICSQVFNKSYSYHTHIKSKHSEAKFFCAQCPKSFKTGYLLKLHERTHLPDEIKYIHPCEECGKKFSKLTNLRSHIKTIHYNERAFVCDECGKGFKLKCALQEHQYTHTDERPFQCSECPKKFKSMKGLKDHNNQHSDITYPCPKCNTICRTRKLLHAHMDVHKEDKPYKCEICGNEYKRYKALKRHMQTSHIGFHIACEFCDKKFESNTKYRKHQQTTHPEYCTPDMSIPVI